MLSYRKLAMRVLGRPLHTEGIDSPRPASQRAAALVLTAAMLTTLAAPAFADIWRIEDGDITVKAGETEGTNKVSQGTNKDVVDTNTIITNQNKDTTSSHTVTIETNDKNDKVEVTLKDVNIDTSSRNKAAVSVTGEGDTNIKLDGDNALKSDIYRSGIYGSGSGRPPPAAAPPGHPASLRQVYSNRRLARPFSTLGTRRRNCPGVPASRIARRGRSTRIISWSVLRDEATISWWKALRSRSSNRP